MKFKKESELPSSGGAFLKLKDGESVIGVFRGEVHEFYSKWENKKNFICGPEDKDGKFRFRVNFVTQEPSGEWTSKILEQGKTFYLQLGDLNEECELKTTKVKISRKGSTINDTSYAIVPTMKDLLTSAQLKLVEATKLEDLEHKDEAGDLVRPPVKEMQNEPDINF